MRCSHRTNAAEQVVREVFRDGWGSDGCVGLSLRGVFIPKAPVDENEGASGGDVLEIDLPDEISVDDHAVSEEGRPAWEWL